MRNNLNALKTPYDISKEIAEKAKAELKNHKLDWDKTQKKAFKEQVGRKKRAIMLCTVVLNLGILAFLGWFYKSFDILVGMD